MDQEMVTIKSPVKKTLLQTIKYLQQHIKITEVILFGSYATGTSHKYSDIDIAVVSPDFENKDLRYKADICCRTKINCSFDVDIHPFTAKSLKNARPTNFIGHVLKTGTVIFKDGIFLV